MSYDPSHRKQPPPQGGWPLATPPQAWRAYPEDSAYPGGTAYRDADLADGQEEATRQAAYRGAAEPAYEAEPAYRGQPAYQAQPAYRGEPGYQAQPAYLGQPGYQAQPAYRGEPAYQAQPAYQGQPAHRAEHAYRGQPADQGQPAYLGQPSYQDAFDGSADPEYRGYRQPGVADPFATASGGYASGRRGQDGQSDYYGEPTDGFDGARSGYGAASNGYGVATDGFDGAVNGYADAGNGYGAPDDYADHRNGHGWSGDGYGDASRGGYGPAAGGAGTRGYLTGPQDGFAGHQEGFAGTRDGYASSADYLAADDYGEPDYAEPHYTEPGYAGSDYARPRPSGPMLRAPDTDMLPHLWLADRDRRREARRRGLIVGAVTGLLAAAVGIGVATLDAAFVGPQSSPVIVMGDAFIDRMPAALKTMAVDHFGQHGRTVLLLGMYVMIAIVAMAIGVLTRSAPVLGVAAIAVFGLFGAFITITRPQGQPSDVLPSVLGAIAGAIALLWLVRASAPVAPLRPAHGGPAHGAPAHGAPAHGGGYRGSR